MNWYINQEIICIKTHSNRKVVEGNIYIIKGLKGGLCACDRTIIDVGVPGYLYTEIRCLGCGMIGSKLNDGIHWFSESLFAPLDTLDEQIKEALTTCIEI